jgi:hypothetical protein
MIILASLFSCSDSKLGQETDLEKENLKGDVIYVEYIREPLCLDANLEFNDKGFIIRKMTFIPTYNIYEEIEYFYEDGKIVKDVFSRNDVKTNEIIYKPTTYEYGNNGELSETLMERSNGIKIVTKYKYNEDLLIESIENSPISIIKTTFHYTNNQIDSTISQDEDIEDKTIRTTSQYFNDKGQKIKEKHDFGVDLYEYDESNLIIKEVSNRQDGVSKRKYTYEYDDNRNWIKKYSNGKLEKERKIYYKGDDYTDIKNKIEKYKSNFSGNVVKSSNNNSQTESNDNSSSNTYQEPERQQQPEKVKCYMCKGSGNCGECGKIFRVHTWEGNGWKDRNETRLGYVMCSDCSGAGVFYKRSDYPNVGKWEIEKKCYVGNCNSGWKPCNKCNGYGNGTLLGKCRDCKGTGYRN